MNVEAESGSDTTMASETSHNVAMLALARAIMVLDTPSECFTVSRMLSLNHSCWRTLLEAVLANTS